MQAGWATSTVGAGDVPDSFARTLQLAAATQRNPEEAECDDDSGSGSDDAEEEGYSEDESGAQPPVGLGAGPAGAGGIAPPKPLFYERGDTEWDDVIDELPQTGSSLQLKHPPPHHLQTNKEIEPLAPDIEEDEKPNGERVFGKVPNMKVSTTGYPYITTSGKSIVYDSVVQNARRSVNKALVNKPFYELKSENDSTLVFDSLFESGNLYQAHQTGPYSYDLVMKNDFNTNGHTQWYYFSFSNVRKGVKYSFRLVNFYKRSSMYNKGLRPLVYSEAVAEKEELGWHRSGSDVSYKRNEFLYSKPKSSFVRNFYSLSFNIEFDYDNDTCYMAHCYPYTYTDLCNYLTRLESDANTRKICRRRLLCRTIANNRCEMLTITAPRTEAEMDADEKDHNGENSMGTAKKPCVVLSARVHPGESNASWMMKGCIDYLTGNSEGAQRLRKQFVFKVVPMLNPDGVIVGNYRTGLAGTDLNRKWKNPDEDLNPTIFYMKNMMERMRDERGIVLYVDLHGHSVKKNAFIYGCDAKFFDTAENHPSREKPVELENRVFPAMLGNKCGMFNFNDCRFHVKRRKETSGRVVVWRLFTNNSFTLEASFGGADESHSPPQQHFSMKTFEQIGIDLCQTIDDLMCVPQEERDAKRASILAQISEIQLDEGDSDDEGDRGDAAESSDDGSDDDTVENIVLPKRVDKVRKAKLLGKKKPKTKPPPNPKKPEEKPQERPAKPLLPKPSVKDSTPREERPKSPVRTDQPKPDVKPTKEESSDLGTSRCNCPSCQAYEEFIASSLPNFLGAGTAGTQGRRATQNDTSSLGDGASPIASSRPAGVSGEESRAVGSSSHSRPAK